MSNFWKIFITVILTIAIIGGGGYYYLNKKATSDKSKLQTQIDDLNKQIKDLKAASTTSTTTTDETASWKTYSNSAYGFSFKYPSEFSSNELSSYSTNDGVAIDSTSTGGFEQPHLVLVEAEQSSLSLDDYLAKVVKDGSFSGAAKITFAGQTAYEGDDNGMVVSYGILVKKGSNIYHIVLDSGNKDSLTLNKTALSSTQKTILSSFQFTK